jgi:hypothetical protein
MSVNEIEGAPQGWEVVRVGKAKDGEWYLNGYHEPILCDGYETVGGCVIIRKIEPPKPVYIPWTFETCPVGALVKNKAATERGIITRVQRDGLCVGACWLNYQYVLDQFEQLDGTPCGTVEVLN